jgi:two-component system sensor histidine kinase VicK
MKKRSKTESVIVFAVFVVLEVALVLVLFKSGKVSEDAFSGLNSAFWRPWLGLVTGLLVIMYVMYVQLRAKSLQKHALDEKVKTQTLIESLPDGVILLNDENKVIAVNAKAIEMLGIDPAECISEPLAKFFEGESAQRISADFYGILETSPVKSGPDAAERPVRLKITPLNTDPKTRIGKIVVMELIQRAQAVSEVQQAPRADAEVMATVAGKLCEDFDAAAPEPAKLDAKSRTLLARMFIMSRKVLHYLDEMVAAPGQAGTEKVDIKDLFEITLKDFEALARLKSVTVQKQFQDGKYEISGNRRAILRAMSEIVLNALSYTPAGGTLTAKMQAGDKEIKVTVLDNGCGIDRPELSRVYDKGFKGNNQSEDTAAGRGVGLAVARAAAEAHGGSIWVESEKGRGTMVTVVLPRR